jgi:hypothetical protein
VWVFGDMGTCCLSLRFVLLFEPPDSRRPGLARYFRPHVIYRMTREQLRILGTSIIRQIPNLARQRSLEAELNTLWDELHT